MRFSRRRIEKLNTQRTLQRSLQHAEEAEETSALSFISPVISWTTNDTHPPAVPSPWSHVLRQPPIFITICRDSLYCKESSYCIQYTSATPFSLFRMCGASNCDKMGLSLYLLEFSIDKVESLFRFNVKPCFSYMLCCCKPQQTIVGPQPHRALYKLDLKCVQSIIGFVTI